VIDPIPEISGFLSERGYRSQTPPLGATMLMVKKGRGLGPFFPYVDFVFVHEIDGATCDAAAIERFHGEAVAYAEGQFRLPRLLRYRIPNVVTIAVSQTGVSDALLEVATRSRQRQPATGGAKDSVYLLDTRGRRLHSAGPERTPTPHGGSATMAVNPTNRVFEMLTELERDLFRASAAPA
jgi:hypothetical protein